MSRTRAGAAALVALTFVLTACLPTPMPPWDPATRPVRVMVVGDSFAFAAGLGLHNHGTATGQMQVLNDALIGCGVGRGGRNRGIGLDREWPTECQHRDARWAMQLAAFQPDVVLIAGGMWDATDRLIPGQRRWTHLGVPAYDWYLALEMQHLTRVLGQTGARVVWTTSPHWNPRYDPALFMGPPPYREASPERADRYNQVLFSAVPQMPRTHVLDLAGWMRAFPGGEFSPALRVDGVHFTLESTDVVARDYLGPWLGAIAQIR